MSFFIKGLVMIWILAGRTVFAADTDCGPLTTYQEVARCAEARSAEVLGAQAVVQEKKSNLEAARQWQNPELSVNSVSGQQNAETRGETDITLSFPVSLGGKRSSQIERAQADVAVAEAEMLSVQGQARKEVYLQILRWQHWLAEKSLLEESLETFSKLVRQYEARPALAPEQEVNLTVFRMAQADYQLKLSAHAEEKSQLDSYFFLHLGKTPEGLAMRSLTPIKWPEVSGGSKAVSASVQKVSAEALLSRAGLAQAQSDAWPSLSLGPSLKISKEAGQDLQQLGFNISLPLPVFNFNGPARKAAQTLVQWADQKKELVVQEETLRRESLERNYKKSVEVLTGLATRKDLEKQHRKIESLFLRGVVPSASVIEAHRGLVDLEKSRNERQNKTAEAYFDILILDGKTVEWFL